MYQTRNVEKPRMFSIDNVVGKLARVKTARIRHGHVRENV